MLEYVRQHRPLARHRGLSIASFVVHLIAFILLLLVGLSLPITKAIYLLSVKSNVEGLPPTSVATELRFGVWGFCASNAINPPSWYTNNGECFGPRLGYDVPADVLATINFPVALANFILSSLLALLILHLVAAGCAFISLLASLYLASQIASICGLIMSIIASILASMMFAVDLSIILVAKNKVDDLTHGSFLVNLGNAIWMVMIAAALSWAGVILLSVRACYCCGIRRKDTY